MSIVLSVACALVFVVWSVLVIAMGAAVSAGARERAGRLLGLTDKLWIYILVIGGAAVVTALPLIYQLGRIIGQ